MYIGLGKSAGSDHYFTGKIAEVMVYDLSLIHIFKLRSLYVNGERAYMTQKDSQGRGDYGSYTVDSSKDWAWISGTRAAGTQLDAGAIPLDTRNQDDIELMTQLSLIHI